MNEFLICWIILAVSLAMAAPVIIHKIRDDEDQHHTVVESGPREKIEEVVDAGENPQEAVVVGDAMAKELET
jgi:hypothetical protein